MTTGTTSSEVKTYVCRVDGGFSQRDEIRPDRPSAAAQGMCCGILLDSSGILAARGVDNKQALRPRQQSMALCSCQSLLLLAGGVVRRILPVAQALRSREYTSSPRRGGSRGKKPKNDGSSWLFPTTRGASRREEGPYRCLAVKGGARTLRERRSEARQTELFGGSDAPSCSKL